MTKQRYDTISSLQEALPAICQKINLPYLANIITLKFNTRIYRYVAYTLIYKAEIQLSAKLWKHLTAKQRYETLVHEVCHVASPYINTKYFNEDSTGHGQTWLNLMALAEVKPLLSLDFPSLCFYRPQKHYVTKCKSCGVEIAVTKNKKTKLERGNLYKCGKCGKIF